MKKSFLLLVLLLLFKTAFSQQYIVETVINGVTNPTAFAFMPDSNVIINQKGGLSRIFTLSNVNVSTFWSFIDSEYVGGEAGLIGVCLDPDYLSNRYIYFCYIHNTPRSMRVVRLTDNNHVGTNPLIIFNDTIAANVGVHFAGNIAFGPGNKLYISAGNNGSGVYSQSLSSFKGKMLRINSDGTIPTDNPFYDDGNPHTGNDDRIWAYGLRNSYGFCFSPFNDSIYATENGDGNPDEINFIRKGKNYGYPFCPGYCSPYNPLYQNPMTELPGNGVQDYAPTGILVYTGSVMPEFTGKVLVVGAGAGIIFHGLVKCDLGNAPFNDTIVNKTIVIDWTGYTALAEGPDGFIYASQFSYNGINRLRPNPNYVSNENTPAGFSLSQNYPNPFNPITSILYETGKAENVKISIYDILGKEVSTVLDSYQYAGKHIVAWDASNYPSGVYFYKLTAGDYAAEKKMVLIK